MDISFVVIGYNEAASLGACLASIRQADLGNLSWEVIYVDGGSRDHSRRIAETEGVHKLLGDEKRRRAAENRNLGIQHARGDFIQLLDGDMALAPDWPGSALDFFRATPDAAAVCGNLKETNPSLLFQALQIDWRQSPGEIAACGGAAMWRREVLLQAGGFPEFVTYGEEPYLCWRVRNELGKKIYYLDQLMAFHDLDYRGIGDYWQRNVRVGESYAEIAALCLDTTDKLWFKEAVLNLLWSIVYIFSALFLFFAPLPIRVLIVLVFFLVLSRKLLQLMTSGHPPAVSFMYTAHLYGSKLPIAWGECLWLWKSLIKKLKHLFFTGR
jgi:glycosyltransferase involved in cell wall biosynthesis